MRYINVCGYVFVKRLTHPKSGTKGYIYEHVIVMEKMIGRYLKQGELVHHINGDRADNRPSNLMLFESRPAHIAFEWEMKAFRECGNRKWLTCNFCHQWDDPENLSGCAGRKRYHKKCNAKYVCKSRMKG